MRSSEILIQIETFIILLHRTCHDSRTPRIESWIHCLCLSLCIFGFSMGRVSAFVLSSRVTLNCMDYVWWPLICFADCLYVCIQVPVIRSRTYWPALRSPWVVNLENSTAYLHSMIQESVMHLLISPGTTFVTKKTLLDRLLHENMSGTLVWLPSCLTQCRLYNSLWSGWYFDISSSSMAYECKNRDHEWFC